MRREYAEQGRAVLFALLRQFLPGSAEPESYERAAQQLGLALGTLKSEVHRLRRRLRALVREEVAHTVSTPHEIEEEMTYLQQVLMEPGVPWAAPVQLAVADS